MPRCDSVRGKGKTVTLQKTLTSCKKKKKKEVHYFHGLMKNTKLALREDDKSLTNFIQKCKMPQTTAPK